MKEPEKHGLGRNRTGPLRVGTCAPCHLGVSVGIWQACFLTVFVYSSSLAFQSCSVELFHRSEVSLLLRNLSCQATLAISH